MPAPKSMTIDTAICADIRSRSRMREREGCSMSHQFREYRPPPIAPPYRNHMPAPPRVESSPIAAICPQDLDQPPPDIERHEPPWRNRRATRR